jgi:hypothetical protein
MDRAEARHNKVWLSLHLSMLVPFLPHSEENQISLESTVSAVSTVKWIIQEKLASEKVS